MLTITLLTTLAATALALPSQPVQPPLNTKVDYLQGTTATDCGITVASGSINATTCNNILVQGLSIYRLPDRDCTFTLYKGDTSCLGTDTDMVQQIPIAKGDENEAVCFPTGVMDGGRWYRGSGRWQC